MEITEENRFKQAQANLMINYCLIITIKYSYTHECNTHPWVQ